MNTASVGYTWRALTVYAGAFYFTNDDFLQPIALGGDFRDRFHRVRHTGFICGHHDRDEPCIRTERSADVIGIDLPTAVYRNVCNFAARRFQMLARVQHGVMFDSRGNDMPRLG